MNALVRSALQRAARAPPNRVGVAPRSRYSSFTIEASTRCLLLTYARGILNSVVVTLRPFVIGSRTRRLPSTFHRELKGRSLQIHLRRNCLQRRRAAHGCWDLDTIQTASGSNQWYGETMIHSSEYSRRCLRPSSSNARCTRHVNNVRYVRFFESGRIHWMRALGNELGGLAKADAMLKGKGVSLILKSLSVDYKYPVVFPDTLLVAHQPHLPQNSRNGAQPRQAQTHFSLKGAMWSYAQRRIVTECDSVIVWYDYDKLAKCDPGEKAKAAITRRMRGTLQES